MSAHAGSLISFMSLLQPGQSITYVCNGFNQSLSTLRRVTTASRYPKELQGRTFTGRQVTVVFGIGDAKVGVSITRTS